MDIRWMAGTDRNQARPELLAPPPVLAQHRGDRLNDVGIGVFLTAGQLLGRGRPAAEKRRRRWQRPWRIRAQRLPATARCTARANRAIPATSPWPALAPSAPGCAPPRHRPHFATRHCQSAARPTDVRSHRQHFPWATYRYRRRPRFLAQHLSEVFFFFV
jgi:hypothetical protein